MSSYPRLDAVYIGVDPEYPLAYEVCRRSILKYEPDLKIYPVEKIKLKTPNLYNRQKNLEEHPDYRYTRFLVPYLNRFKGYVLYCDSSMFWFSSPRNLEQHIDPNSPVNVVCTKDENIDDDPDNLGNIDNIDTASSQDQDPREHDHSSQTSCCGLMIFNCSHYSCIGLRPNDINTKSKKWFHTFQWVEPSCKIGNLPAVYQLEIDQDKKETNPYNKPDEKHLAVQYTMGGPWMKCCHDRLYTHWWMKYLTWEEKQSIIRGQK